MRKPHVLLMIESSRAYGRGCLQGVARYLRNHRSWIPIPVERGLNDDVPACVRKTPVDGVLARVASPRLARRVRGMGVPVVDLLGAIRVPGVAAFDTDPAATARMAADHLLERGFRQFAYCGFPGVPFSDQRSAAFVSYLEGAGQRVSVYHPAKRRRGWVDALGQELQGTLREDHIAGWLKSLPRPVGLMACNDVRGRQVLEACYWNGLKVPEEVAVIGADNDEVICDLAVPPMSSIEPDAIRIGFEGAALIDRMIHGGKCSSRERLIPPRGIVTRMSTDVLAVKEPTLVNALHYIREHAGTGIGVDDVLDHVVVSRSTLERLFRRWLGRTPKDEIQRLRMERVKQLLLDTNYRLWEVARLTGFKTEPQFIAAFRTHTGQTPGHFRRTARGGC